MDALKSWSDAVITNESLADKVYNLLESSILNMDLKPGEVLSEDEIAGMLNVSRSPIREALLRLEHAGLVNKSKKSRIVAEITEEKLLNDYHFWSMTESYAAGIACIHATEQQLDAIYALAEEMRHGKDKNKDIDIQECRQHYRELNYNLHKLLVAPCPYKNLAELHRNAINYIKWGYNYTVIWPEDIGNSYTQHSKILKAYCNRNRSGVEAAVREHIEGVSHRLQNFFLRKNHK